MVTSINRSFNFEVKYVVPPPGLRHDELLEHSDVFLSHELPSCIIHFFLKNITLHVTIV
jgi:hypothetical protein